MFQLVIPRALFVGVQRKQSAEFPKCSDTFNDMPCLHRGHSANLSACLCEVIVKIASLCVRRSLQKGFVVSCVLLCKELTSVERRGAQIFLP
jgi:hypothetical protein